MRRVAFPADRMASRPITPGHGADVERHLYAFAHVVAGAADLYGNPTGGEIAGAPGRVPLETAPGQDISLGVGSANLERNSTRLYTSYTRATRKPHSYCQKKKKNT